LERYDRNIIVSDIDCQFIHSPFDLFEAMENKAEVGYFSSPGPAPNLLYPAPLLFFRNGDAAHRFLKVAGDYMRAKLAEHDVWTVDQAGLLRAIAELSKTEPEHLQDLTESTGGFRSFQRHNEETDLKRSLRGNKDNRLSFNIGPDGKPIFLVD